MKLNLDLCGRFYITFTNHLDYSWSDNIDDYASQYNTGAHQSLGCLSPFEVFFGRKCCKSNNIFADTRNKV